MLDDEELLFDKLYEKTKYCGRTQFIKLLMGKERENKKLKEKYENAVADYETTMSELQELKKQLEEYKEEIKELEFIVGLRKKRNLIHKFDKEYDEEDKKKNPNRDYAGIMPDAEEVYRRYYTMKNQQKEFIEWLTSYIELLNNKPDLIEESEIDLLKEILSKYKETIGVSNE